MTDDLDQQNAKSETASGPPAATTEARMAGCLLGCAVGDAIGLPYEGLSARRAKRFAKLPLKHRFVLGRGMVSDDTDHTVFVLQALIESRGNGTAFKRALAWRLRWWLACLPAGIGWATLRATLRLWLGIRKSGVHSAGNGPAMRSAIIGVVNAHDVRVRHELVRISTELTHTDPRALASTMAVAEVAAHVAIGHWRERPTLDEFITVLLAVSNEPDWLLAVEKVRAACESESIGEGIVIAEGAFSGKNGVSGYALHSVPFALVVWYLHFGDYRGAIESITQAGGDVDTVAAITGALAGATVTDEGIPQDWLRGVTDWPHSVSYLRELARCAAADDRYDVPTSFRVGLLPRGVVFTVLVLCHGLRRLFPPYC
jgi:ADP-ribosyl-[dinitrogen reductase] hydrolase